MGNNQLFEIQYMIQNSIQTQTGSVELESIVQEKPPLSNSERIAVYQNAYLIRMTESINDDFEILKSQMSKDEFDVIVRNYVLNNPSDVRNLAEYSLKLPHFILQEYPDYYEYALKDEMILRSNQALDDENTIKLEEVQNGQTFNFQKHPACILSSMQTHFIMAYRSADDVVLATLSEKEYCILNFLEVEQSLNNLENLTQSIKMSESLLQPLISEWITKKIVLLKRSS